MTDDGIKIGLDDLFIPINYDIVQGETSLGTDYEPPYKYIQGSQESQTHLVGSKTFKVHNIESYRIILDR